jgi:serine protease Do
VKRGDVIRTVNGKKIADATALQVAVSEIAPGTPISLGILRDGSPMTLKATVGQYHAQGQEAENSGPKSSQHVKLGISVDNLTPDVRQQINAPASVHGVVIENVSSGSPAALAGLQTGDVIMEVDRHPVDNVDSFMNQIQSIPAGQNVLLLVWSKQGTIYLVVQPNQGGM